MLDSAPIMLSLVVIIALVAIAAHAVARNGADRFSRSGRRRVSQAARAAAGCRGRLGPHAIPGRRRTAPRARGDAALLLTDCPKGASCRGQQGLGKSAG